MHQQCYESLQKPMVTITAFDFMSCWTPREQKGSALAGSATIVKDLSKDIANTKCETNFVGQDETSALLRMTDDGAEQSCQISTFGMEEIKLVN